MRKENKELVIARYFSQWVDVGIPITKEDENKFLEYVSNWLHKDEVKSISSRIKRNGFLRLVEGKRRSWIMCGEYEKGILEGTVPVCDLVKDEDGNPIPREIFSFIAKELFKWKNYDRYMDVYESVRIS